MTNKFTIVTGHYGAGKTTYCVNLALRLAEKGGNVAVADLDIVNPYFRISDYADLFREKGIALLTPKYANSNIDAPSLNFGLNGLQNNENTHFIADVGGDDAGAFALGRYADVFRNSDVEMLYVVNKYRYLTRTAQDAVRFLREIELAGGVKCTAIVNNSNLGKETTEETILGAVSFGEEIAEIVGVPVIISAPMTKNADFTGDSLYKHCFL